MLRRTSNTSRNKMRPRSIYGLAFSIVLVVLTVGAFKAEALGQDSPAQRILRKGMSYYDNDNITDQAAIQFNMILKKYKDSPEAESAQFYLASYYQRKFYIIKRTQGKEDTRWLVKARTEYGKYTKQYFKNGANWLSDAFFNLALVYFQLNESRKAGWELNKMSDYASMDPQVYIHEVVWSSDSGDVIDGYYQARALADFVKKLTADKSNWISARESFPDFINLIKRWCRAERTK